jgi:predicted enzyme related to lactoylglutathione lyase
MLRDMPGRFCWLDLAATDAGAAAAFYAEAFDWTVREMRAAGGTILRFRHGGHDVGSAYQLRPRHLAAGVPSHWTPYLRVLALEGAAARVAACGGRVIVPPFAVSDRVRIALVQDVVGALLGLWQEDEAHEERQADATG